MHKQSLQLAAAAFRQNIAVNSSGDFILDERGLVSSAANGLNGTYVQTSASDLNSLANFFGSKTMTVPVGGTTGSLDMSRAFSEDQIRLVQPFVNSLLQTASFSDTSNLASRFQEQVISSDLDVNDMHSLLSLSASVQALDEFMAEGGIPQLQPR